ncbi:MAG TPA: adenylyl-sulfate kinase [Xanthobacteraceae bacterium]|nr:adenylyl-sulfate kinase [Xanthobacteraceae bacterium]
MNMLIADPLAETQAGKARALMRIVIVGHVDHGKSTLIGRLLHETGSLPDGKLEALRSSSARRGMPFEWSFLLDALQTERDHGITIDTSQIRFRTMARDVVLIDAPGHTEFLRNMITGAAQADAALLIIDAVEGVRDQTRRHGYLLHLLGVRQIAVVINKMDRVGYDKARFRSVEADISTELSNLGLTAQAVIPISAREGDGVARRSSRTAWHHGPTVLEALDSFTPAQPMRELSLRMPVQAVYKFDDRRIIAGRIETGRIAVGDAIVVMPSGTTTRVRSIETWPAPIDAAGPQTASAGHSVGITLDDEIFVDRGDIVATAAMRPKAVRRLRARVFWLGETPLSVGASLDVRIGTAGVRAILVRIEHAIDPGRLSPVGAAEIARNHVGEIELALTRPVAADPHSVNPRTGRIVLEADGRIAGGGLVLSVDVAEEAAPRRSIVPVKSAVPAAERTRRFGHHGAVVWLTGLPGSGKSTLGRALEERLFSRGGMPMLLDGDTLRGGLNADLGFSAADRAENIRRIAEVAAHLARNGVIAIVAAVSPSACDRAAARAIGGSRFYEVFAAAPPDICEQRDPKGHYRRARSGAMSGFTGVSAPYEAPVAPDLAIATHLLEITAAVDQLERFLEEVEVLAGADQRLSPDVSI